MKHISRLTRTTFALMTYFSLPFVSFAQPGTLDPTFGTGGIVTTVQTDAAYAVAMQSDGKIVVVGNSYIGNNDYAVARYDSVGLLDPTFGIGGIVTTSFLNGFWNGTEVASSVAIQSDGKIVVAGNTYYYNANVIGLARYNSNGSLDSSFGVGGLVITANGAATSLAIQNDGKIVVAGRQGFFPPSPTGVDIALFRYNINGSIDSTFGTAGVAATTIGDYEEGNSVAIQNDGSFVVAGYSTTAGNTNFALVRYTTIGTLDPFFGIGGIVTTDIGNFYDAAKSVAIQSDGKIVVAGKSGPGGNTDFAVVRYDSNGTLDSTFGTSGIVTTNIGTGNNEATSLVIQSDSKIVVAGVSYDATTNYDFALARYTGNGTLDASFGTGGIVTTAIVIHSDYCGSVVLQSDGKIVAVGSSFPPNSPGASTDFTVVRYNGNGVTGLSEADNEQTGMSLFPNPLYSSATIQFNSTIKNGELIIFNVFGQKVKSIKNVSTQTITFYRDNLPAGLYLIQLTQENKIIGTSKLIITD
ncbi:MAG: T9SS type A sorting domain-containing protein [Bacteroidetes bacterium]|nr:T9SS type A sorting domain-containing protein [Bacteroidota bacterium]